MSEQQVGLKFYHPHHLEGGTSPQDIRRGQPEPRYLRIQATFGLLDMPPNPLLSCPRPQASLALPKTPLNPQKRKKLRPTLALGEVALGWASGPVRPRLLHNVLVYGLSHYREMNSLFTTLVIQNCVGSSAASRANGWWHECPIWTRTIRILSIDISCLPGSMAMAGFAY